ncbi:MAG: homoaconitate hydratase family protein, partial [Thaumarchaeota archaeon]
MNITEKILARASGKPKVSPGDVIFVNVDKVMVHDVSGPGVIAVFEKLKKGGMKIDRLWDPDKVWVAEDHFVPAADKISAQNIVLLTNFTKQFGIKKHFKYGMGQYGICHTLSHEEAMVSPGEVYVGGDSHTNTTGALGAFAAGLGHTDVAYVMLNGKIWFKVPETLYFKLNGKLPDYVMAKDFILKIIGDIGTDGAAYKTMQFGGTGISEMSVEERLTLTNMTTEAGAKNGIIEPDQQIRDYLEARGASKYNEVHGDADARYEKVYEYEASELEPIVAKPFSPENIVVARELSSTELDKAYIGSCTGAKLEDLRAVAKILKGRTVKIRTEVLPAAMSIFRKAMDEGL